MKVAVIAPPLIKRKPGRPRRRPSPGAPAFNGEVPALRLAKKQKPKLAGRSPNLIPQMTEAGRAAVIVAASHTCRGCPLFVRQSDEICKECPLVTMLALVLRDK